MKQAFHPKTPLVKSLILVLLLLAAVFMGHRLHSGRWKRRLRQSLT
jgi:hypothetical protein